MAGDQDKTEQPTQHRLEEARNKGEVAKSSDMVGMVGLIAFALTLMLTVRSIAAALTQATERTLLLAGTRPIIGSGLFRWLEGTYFGLLQAVMPMVLALLVVGVVANLVQTGPILTAFPLKPSAQRLNPATALKRLFSMRSLWELGKLVVKLLLLALIAYAAVKSAAGFVGRIALSPVADLPQRLKDGFWTTSLYLLSALLVVAFADLMFVRKDHGKRMRMSRREVRDDAKRRDGDPEVKSRQRRQIRELLKKVRALPRAADADVILTNPTHYAVAVKYLPRSMRAPVVLAKGRGFMAARVRGVGARAGVPVIRVPALARALYRTCDIDTPVPEDLYGQLAPIYRQLYAQGLGTAA
ncbi:MULTISPECIES: EscU/YscU/HrcU family type III secretion system export apparatus switch protein [unclassified Xanthomonas]|uniref:EscU/YscU/HrcU family type III secretion system export apparatus switch protein n=1 Tax=unclassified Xanthomonas TaxID=2643310 RepID=UPI002A83DF90|nr:MULTISPECIES: EscU/YscU/HrcU family type III secretion system export apparatus switch protein [unclassified Xanthomonas]MDY4297349.1 EscU/YscU/HrcU family type III secretion system export apparatus switch protein [Xanthomonas sp. LF02-5]MDY4359143.1 EscU/YscU/HrcU family type III secretion system export apparatus switch protein [Xanthomonas sp. LF04-12]